MLSQQAQDVIEHYKTLKIAGKTIKCPYYNNERQKMRAALRARIGKGSPEEIEHEALVIAIRDGVQIDVLNDEALQKFLVDSKLGIDCSGFVYYVLEAEARAHKKNLKKSIKFSGFSFLRKLVARLRTVENVGVQILAHDQNSHSVDLSDIQPGDMIVMIGYDDENKRDHILLVTSIEDDKILYVQSCALQIDGKYDHGIKGGMIEVIDSSKSLLKQQWTEDGCENESNETWQKAQNTETFSVRRLRIFD